MATRTTTKTDPATEARQALEQRRQRRDEEQSPIPVTIEQRAIAATLRERDHAEGCPAFSRSDGPARIEAYAERVIAPGPDLRDLQAESGDVVIVVRCHECGRLRYPTNKGRHTTPEAALDQFVDERLEALAGGQSDPDLDETLE